jgi:GNAT superfamily N-acetyltransferase
VCARPLPDGVRLRKGRVGDLGWMVHRQAVVYAEEFGYSPLFETYLHEGAAVFLRKHDARRDRVWVAEAQPRMTQIAQTQTQSAASAEPSASSASFERRVLGFVAIQHDPDRRGWAKLRWFLVEEEARGHGVGARLMKAALAFSRKAGYKGVLLWTVDDLHAARALYEKAGFTLAFQDPKPCRWAPWGHEQRWELSL